MLDTSVKFSGAGDDYPGYRYSNKFSPAPLHDTPGFERRGSEPSIPRAQGSSAKGGPHQSVQHSSAEQVHDSSLSDRERLGFLDSGAGSQPHGANFEIRPWFSSAQPTPVFSDEFAVRRTDFLLSLSAGMVGSQGTTRVPAELPSMGVRNPGVQRAGRRKQSTSPDVIALFFTLIFCLFFSTLSPTHTFIPFKSLLLSLFSTLLSRYRLAIRLMTLTNSYDLMTIPFILFLFFIHTLSFDEMRTR